MWSRHALSLSAQPAAGSARWPRHAAHDVPDVETNPRKDAGRARDALGLLSPRYPDNRAQAVSSTGVTVMDFDRPELVMLGTSGTGARDGRAPDADAVAAHVREHYEPLFWAPGTIEEIEYRSRPARCSGTRYRVPEMSDPYLKAELTAWAPASSSARQLTPPRRAQTAASSSAWSETWATTREILQPDL